MMLVLLLCIVMKIAEISVGRTSPTARPPPPPPPPTCDRRCRRCRRCRRYRNRSPPSSKRSRHRLQSCGDRCISQKFAGEGVAVMEEPQTPGSDCNSNPATDSIQQDLVGSEFVQDNVEYQWFIDYGYRDGGLHIHPSVLSSLSASYTPKDLLGYYDDLARNLDANLAEIDMESFRTADIHTLLTALPVMCTEPVQHSEFNCQREQYASISGSVMEKLDIGSSISPHTSSQGEDSACSTADTISICKSSLLFSPVKETPMLPPGGSYSVDSLDCEDMLLTCQTNNKNNYTIAFEGSMTMYSDGSQDFENHDKHKTYESPDVFYDKPKDMKAMLDLSMACSDSKIYTTWSNLKHSSMNKVITRHPSGNNNTIPDISQSAANLTLGGMNKRSQSLPDLSCVREFQHINIPLNFSVDSAESSNHMQRLHSSGSAMSRSTNAESSVNGENAGTKKLQNLSLVRLFMKQKSMSVEGMSLALDQSDSVSDNSGWPTSNSGSDSATNTNTQIQRQNGQDNSCDRRVPENDFSINWIRRDVTNNRDAENQKDSLNVLKCAIRNKDDKVEMASSASVEELSESISKSGSTSGQRSFDINNPFEQKNSWAGLTEKKHPICRTTGIQANAEMEDNAVQTSLIFTALKENHGGPLLQETTVNKKPVYVVYPNYTLPDLSFLKTKDTKIDNIALKPHTFDRNKMEWKRTVRSGRPFSCNDIDALRQRGFAHVKDWESLTFLLPYEYKKILHDVPEVSRYININEEVRRPLFCLSPPMRHKTRPISEIIPNNTSSTSSTATQPSSGYRGSSTILTDSSTNQQPLSSNAINPLYLYRYDSISSEASLVNNDKKMHRFNQTRQTCPSLPKRSVSLPQGEGEPDFSNRVPPRPPLPRSILRKNKVLTNKRYSMFEMGDVGEQSEEQSVEINKRMSLQEPYYMNNDLQLLCRERTIDSEKDVDETEAERYLKEKLNDITNNANVESETSQHSDDDIKQLEEYLKRSAISSQSSDGDIDNAEVKVRSYVRKFLALKMNKDPLRNIDMGESQRKTVSFAVHQRKKHLDAKLNNLNIVVNEQSQDQAAEDRLIELEEKKKMVSSVNRAVDLLLKYWNADSNHSRPNYNEKNECAQICLSNLCPALYTIMSDGLKPHLNSTFGPITNSVWQVVEASSQQGPLTKTLNELVQRINGEDVITEGMLKFHAFVFGLLNLRALDAWFAYLCTRESILRKHYNNNSLFVAALANANIREIVDSLLYILNPLAFCPFHLDLLYQYRQLQNSFGNINNHTVNAMSFRNADLTMKDLEGEETESCGMVPSPKKTRPRSCIAYNMDDKCSIAHKSDLQNAKKRFSAINPKAFYALDKLTSEDSEDYTDSLEHSPLNKRASKQPQQSKLFSPDAKPNDDDGLSTETKFKKLQETWELMISKEGSKVQPTVMTPSSPVRTFGVLGKSKIPRLLTSPVKQSNVAANIVGKSSKSPISGISLLKKPANLPTTKTTLKKPMDTKARDVTRRTSRVDQDTLGVTRIHTARPSSLPYKSHGVTSNDKNLISPHRRAVSTSLPRPTVTTVSRTPASKHPHKEVRTLTHRIPSDTGHLSFVEGEKLKVILEVDNKWLLCAKGDRRGLVPRACVRSVQT